MRSPERLPPRRRPSKERESRKKAYKPPALVEYGDITELTRSAGGTGFDGISGTGGV